MARKPVFKPIIVECPCEKGTMFKTSLIDEGNRPVMAVIVDNVIIFKGYCSHCGQKNERRYDLLELFIFTEVH